VAKRDTGREIALKRATDDRGTEAVEGTVAIRKETDRNAPTSKTPKANATGDLGRFLHPKKEKVR